MTEVAVGQVWEDCDPRQKGRMVKVIQILEEGSAYRGAVVPERTAVVEVMSDGGGRTQSPNVGKHRLIKTRRLRPGSSGYKLQNGAW